MMKYLYSALGFFFSFVLQAQTTHIVVVGVDGLNSYRFKDTLTPNLDYIKANGSWTFNANCNMPSSSSTNWASIICGATPKEHLITRNGFDKNVYRNTPTCASEPDYFPTIFTLLNRQKPKLKAGLFHQWIAFARLVKKDKFSRKICGVITPEMNVDNAMIYYKGKKSAITFMHLDQCDHAGHKYGHESPEYLEAIQRTDKILGRVIKTIQRHDKFENTVLIVVTDHGGISKGHGGNSPQEINTPWLIMGKGIKKNHTIQTQVKNEDTALMMAKILGLESHPCWTGKVISEVFE